MFLNISFVSSLRTLSRHFFLMFNDLSNVGLLAAGGVGGTYPGGKNAEVGAPGEGAPPYKVPYLLGVGAVGRLGLKIGMERFSITNQYCFYHRDQ